MFAAFFKKKRPEVVVAPIAPGKAEDGSVGIEQPFAAQVVERWHQLTPRQVPRRPKDNNRTRIRHPRGRSAAINSTHCHDVLLWCLDSSSREYDIVYPLIKRQGWLRQGCLVDHTAIGKI